jgi:hypothetical protein
MAGQHGRAVLQRQGAACLGEGIGQRRQRILHCRHIQPGGLKPRNDLAPTGAIGPGAMDQHDVSCLDRYRRLGECLATGKDSRQQANGHHRHRSCTHRSILSIGLLTLRGSTTST